MSTHEISSLELEYDADEYADNEIAALEAKALHNGVESEDEDEESDGGGTISDGDNSGADEDSSSSDDESTETESEKNTVRGLTRLKKQKKKFKGQKKVIEFDKLGRFKGEYKSEIASYMGVLVRRDVGLRHLKWKKVKSVLRDKLWHELLRFYAIEETMRRQIMKYFGEHLRNFRRKLYVKFIVPNLGKPSKLKKIPKPYRCIVNQEQWDGFVEWRLSDECKELSTKGVKARKSHKYNHRTGRSGYAGLLEKLIKEKEIREDENSSRSLLWRKAHQNKNGEYDDDDVREKAAHLEFDKQLEDGTLEKKAGTDSITLVFGEEHGGRVRCAAKGVTPTAYWHLPRKGASKEHIELKKQLDDERRTNQMERERKDEEIKEMKEAMNEQAKMMSNLVSQLQSQGVLKKTKNKSKKARKSTIREKSIIPEAPVRSNSSTERREYNQSTALKDSSELQIHLRLNSLEESRSKNKTELSTIGGKCKLAHASLRNIIALGSVLPSVSGQLVHGVKLKDDCVRVKVEESILKNHFLPIPSTHLKIVEDAKKYVVAWPKEFVICCSTVNPDELSDPDEHDAVPNTKKRKNKKTSNTKSGELNSQRSSKRLKIAA
ncbi:hypothetical protein MKX03_034732 [Papaver bracteatum]|nr:hypothetical protein MKX03_034732 [Papaver bracteatum]